METFLWDYEGALHCLLITWTNCNSAVYVELISQSTQWKIVKRCALSSVKCPGSQKLYIYACYLLCWFRNFSTTASSDRATSDYSLFPKLRNTTVVVIFRTMKQWWWRSMNGSKHKQNMFSNAIEARYTTCIGLSDYIEKQIPIFLVFCFYVRDNKWWTALVHMEQQCLQDLEIASCAVLGCSKAFVYSLFGWDSLCMSLLYLYVVLVMAMDYFYVIQIW